MSRLRVTRPFVQALIVAVLVLGVVTPVWAYDPYWLGGVWDEGYTRYYINGTVPGSYTDDFQWAAQQWSGASPFYFQQIAYEPYDDGGNIGWVDEMQLYYALTDLWTSGGDLHYFSIQFDETENWTDAPCSHFWDTGIRVASAALHELGHVFDFKAVPDTDTVMYGSPRCYDGLMARDIAAVDEIY